MKNNSKIVGIVLLCGALGLMAWQSHDQAKRLEAWKKANPQAVAAQTQVTTTPVTATASAAAVATPMAIAPVVAMEPETLTTVENALVKATFTTRGGALRSVAFKDYPATQGGKEPYVWSMPERSPALALADAEGVTADVATYKLVKADATSVVYQKDLGQGLTLERHYTLTTPEKSRTAKGYEIAQSLVWRNSSAQALQLPDYTMVLGTALPTHSDPTNTQLNFGTYNGKDGKFVTPTVFKAGGFLFWSKAATARYEVAGTTTWATVKNQFFANVTTPVVPAIGAWATPAQTSGETPSDTLAGGLKFKGVTVPAAGATTVELSSYIGPMEYARLSSMGAKQDEVMQWGWPIFSFFAKLFISMLNGIAKAVQNYGIAIVALTLIIRGVLWPFTNAAAQASKKMAAVQPMLKEIQAKYKDKPEKLQKETLRIFTENQVNPMAGCLPAMLQIPVFLGFFYMLRSAAELRFESFLWMKDLSMPDTVAVLGGFPINPMPIIMTFTMYYQMKLTPSAGDPEQQKIMQFTPFIFAFMLYNFSSGLTLYWTLSNLASIVQQLVINNQKLPPVVGGNDDDKNGKVIDVATYKA